jgi:hypothetical protein
MRRTLSSFSNWTAQANQFPHSQVKMYRSQDCQVGRIEAAALWTFSRPDEKPPSVSCGLVQPSRAVHDHTVWIVFYLSVCSRIVAVDRRPNSCTFGTSHSTCRERLGARISGSRSRRNSLASSGGNRQAQANERCAKCAQEGTTAEATAHV